MKCLRYVCLIALGAGTAITPQTFAQTPALQKGVSVQMAFSNVAKPMLEADKLDAWIIAVTASSQMYFGTQAVTSDQLVEQMKTHPRYREAKLYIKAGARVPYATVKKALEDAKEDLFSDVVLLTKQPESPAIGMMVPPMGLDVLLATPSSSEPVGVQISRAGDDALELRVNGATVSISDLPTALTEAFQNRGEKIVVVNADGRLPFAEIVQVIDASRSVGAKTVLPTAEM